MKLFNWQASNFLQQKQQGMIVAENIEMARQALFQRKLQNIKLQRNWQFTRKPKANEWNELINQLALLLKSAVPIKQSLQLLLQNCTVISLNLWLAWLIQDLESGLSFSQAIEKQGKYFSPQEQQLIQVGEMTGKLAQVCEQIAQYRQQSLILQRKLQKILLYPMLVLGISVLLTLLLLIFIVPQFAEMYGNNNANLPTFTALLLHLSEGLQQHFWQLAFLFILVLLFIRFRLQRSPKLIRMKNQCINKMPILGKITQLARLIRFSQALALMLRSGVPLNMALQSFLPKQQSWLVEKSYVADSVLNQAVETALYWLNQGYKFSDSVASDFFPMTAQQMLKIGEESGQVAQMLQYIADKYQQDLNHQVDLLSQLLEPLLMVIIGGLIGAVLLGMYLPIFNMGSMIQ
ncbi:type II secretion system F family protein [Avibacterium sp. 21-586]|uniref:type II secretion system F family protein n=1 Tax=Avibacterium sp. 21-586 TaxID=2911534 RepID=UPI0022457C22|nr:type II secretion system F family protein [Avibacterium sp. 21-586]MCW9710102.1 type II secretion system F family protein [Avibacterium sp. 21-586]